MALYENVTYNAGGKIAENDFMQYKIPTRQDVGHINVEFETSYEPSGPFGVKSIGEIVINTPAPALAHAIYRATGVWHRTVPFTPEKILMGMATLTGAENQKAVQFAWDRTILLCLYDEICMVVGEWDKRIPPHFILHRTGD